MSKPWDRYQGKLQTQNDSGSTEKLCVLLEAEAGEWGYLSKSVLMHMISSGAPASQHRAAGFEVCPTEFLSWFGGIIPCYVSILPFGMGTFVLWHCIPEASHFYFICF